jgi:putative SOS response-associated peptidase YedK
MCNLYHLSPKGAVEQYIGKQLRTYLPDYDETKPIGPFQTGFIIRSAQQGERDNYDAVGTAAQWGMIQPKAKTRRPESRVILTNNARIEGIDKRITYRDAWQNNQRCLIPAAWYQEPNWETGKNIWWRLRRAGGLPWMLAGIWSEWTDPDTGEIVPNYSMITTNCDGHPLLGRLHRPEPDLPPDKQDKRAVVHIRETDWHQWLQGTIWDALTMIRPQPAEMFDLTDAQLTDVALRSKSSNLRKP